MVLIIRLQMPGHDQEGGNRLGGSHPFVIMAIAQSQAPEQLVRRFYEHIGLELGPAVHTLFTPPLRRILEDNDKIIKSGEGQRLDPNIALDAPEYEKDEIEKSLKMAGSVDGDKAKVLVSFTVKGEPRRLEWKLVMPDGNGRSPTSLDHQRAGV